MRLYKMQITGLPAEAMVPAKDFDPSDPIFSLNPNWKPAGWKEWVDEAADDWGRNWAQRCRDEGYPFFWPSEKRTYLTKEAAEGKAWTVRRWGGKAIVLEAEVGEFIEVEAAKRNRQQAKDLAKAEKLRAKAEMLRREAEDLEDSVKGTGWGF